MPSDARVFAFSVEFSVHCAVAANRAARKKMHAILDVVLIADHSIT